MQTVLFLNCVFEFDLRRGTSSQRPTVHITRNNLPRPRSSPACFVFVFAETCSRVTVTFALPHFLQIICLSSQFLSPRALRSGQNKLSSLSTSCQCFYCVLLYSFMHIVFPCDGGFARHLFGHQLFDAQFHQQSALMLFTIRHLCRIIGFGNLWTIRISQNTLIYVFGEAGFESEFS